MFEDMLANLFLVNDLECTQEQEHFPEMDYDDFADADAEAYGAL